MEFNKINYERIGTAAWITFDDPENLNAISPELIAECGSALSLAEADAEVRVIVLTGNGRAFCAGANLKQRASELSSSTETVFAQFLLPLKQLLRRYRESPKPIIAAVNGICMAGGMETILCCDLVVAVESAILGDQHATFGLLPAVGGAQGLLRNVGIMRAKEIMLTGGRYSASELNEWGIVNEVAPDDKLREVVQKYVDIFSARSPSGLSRMKQMINNEVEMPWDIATNYELSLLEGHFATGDPAEGLQAFIEKRKPVFRT